MDNNTLLRYHIELGGRIQNCGFRNFCWNCARTAKVTGWVANDDVDYTRVELEVQGTREQIDQFLDLVYKGNGWSKITSMYRQQIPVEKRDKRFAVLY